MSKLDEGLQDLTLTTVVDGVLEEQFQERLTQALEVLRDHRRLASGREGHTVVIPLEVHLIFNAADGTYTVAARANPIKPPKPIPVVRPAYKRGGELKVRPEIQEELPAVLSLKKPEQG